ncbi:hypothetical protein SLE2022_394520 [Rubroshorea leprosula]
MALKNRKDHWAFLGEIEAPIWVDLAAEAKLNGNGIDDEWFHKRHPFHQCSSRELKSAFSRFGEEGFTTESDLLGESSPALPPSVSRSRGKDYRSNNWRGDYGDGSLNKQQPVQVKGKSSGVFSGAAEQIKPKLSFVNLKGTSSSTTSLVPQITRNVKGKQVKLVSPCVDSASISSPFAEKSGESNTGSTVTSENIPKQQQTSFEISSRPIGQTSGLLSSVRISLRRSHVTRQASRVEINADRRGSREHKSSSSKSSVGSSSYPVCDVKSTTVASVKKKEQTPDSRNVARISEAAKNRERVSKMYSKMYNTPGVQVKGGTTVLKPTCRETSISKVHHTLQSKALSYGVNKQNSIANGSTKANGKVGTNKLNKGTTVGKENAIGRISVSQECNSKANAARGMDGGRKGKKPCAPWKGGGTGLVVPKGKVGHLKEGKKLTNVVHMR